MFLPPKFASRNNIDTIASARTSLPSNLTTPWLVPSTQKHIIRSIQTRQNMFDSSNSTNEPWNSKWPINRIRESVRKNWAAGLPTSFRNETSSSHGKWQEKLCFSPRAGSSKGEARKGVFERIDPITIKDLGKESVLGHQLFAWLWRFLQILPQILRLFLWQNFGRHEN